MRSLASRGDQPFFFLHRNCLASFFFLFKKRLLKASFGSGIKSPVRHARPMPGLNLTYGFDTVLIDTTIVNIVSEGKDP